MFVGEYVVRTAVLMKFPVYFDMAKCRFVHSYRNSEDIINSIFRAEVGQVQSYWSENGSGIYFRKDVNYLPFDTTLYPRT